MPDEKPAETHSAADFLLFALDNPTSAIPEDEDDPVEQPTEPETDLDEVEDPDENDPEEQTEADPAEDEEPEDVPQLDPLIEELAKGNPKAERRVREIAEGLEKLKSDSKALKAELETSKPKAETWDSYEKAFSDPKFAGPTLEKLIETVAHHHGLPVEDLLPTLVDTWMERSLGETPGKTAPSKWERRGYTSEREMQMAEELKALRSAVTQFQTAHADFQKERAAAQQQAEFKSYLDEIAPKTIRRLEKLESGWRVTKGMVEKAIREFPQLKDDPVRAVKAAFADELKAHFAKSAGQVRAKRGPEMLPDSRGKGQEIKEPARITAADVYAML